MQRGQICFSKGQARIPPARGDRFHRDTKVGKSADDTSCFCFRRTKNQLDIYMCHIGRESTEGHTELLLWLWMLAPELSQSTHQPVKTEGDVRVHWALMGNICSPSTWETKAGGSLEIWGYPRLCNEFKASLGYRERHCHKQTTINHKDKQSPLYTRRICHNSSTFLNRPWKGRVKSLMASEYINMASDI